MYRTFGADKLRPRRACFLPQRQCKVITFFWIPNKIYSFVYVPAIQSYFLLRKKIALAGKGQAPLNPKFFFVALKKFKMAYGLIRVRNLSMAELNGTEIHNFRQYDEKGIDRPENIKPENDTHRNTHSVLYRDGKPIEADGGFSDEVKKRIEGINQRKNSVVAIEYAVGASSEFFKKGSYNAQTFLERAVEFVAEKHGKNNVISASFHFDESNPHAHVIVVPIVKKTVKWKNKRGQGERTEDRLCARDFTGGPDKLSKLQDDYYQFCKQFEGYGEKKEVVFYRGTKAAQQLKHYTKQTNHEIGVLREEILNAKTQMKLKMKQLELEVKEAEMIKKTTELQQRIEIKKEQNGKKRRTKLP